MLFVFDWDGTLVGDKKALSKNTILALKKIKTLGHKISIATGRHPNEVSSKLKNNHEISKYIIGANGSIIINRHDESTIFINNIKKSLMNKIIDSIKELGSQITYIKLVQNKNIFRFKDIKSLFDPNIKIKNEEELKNSNALIGVEFDNPKNLIIAANNWKNKYKGLFEISISAERFLNFNAFGVNKWNAIKWMLKKIDMQDKVVTFGDSLNDYDMLKHSDFAIAVGDAHHKLIRIADLKISHSDESGILKFANELEKNPNIISIS